MKYRIITAQEYNDLIIECLSNRLSKENLCGQKNHPSQNDGQKSMEAKSGRKGARRNESRKTHDVR